MINRILADLLNSTVEEIEMDIANSEELQRDHRLASMIEIPDQKAEDAIKNVMKNITENPPPALRELIEKRKARKACLN